MNQNHKFCGKCNEVREIQEMKDKGIYKEAAKVIIGVIEFTHLVPAHAHVHHV